MGEHASGQVTSSVYLLIQGPTIYPILFASVVGRATHAILLWRLQKGEKIGTLDILAGSTSLTSTVVSQFHMRLVSSVGLGLIAIWVLSPVGGQSSFRQISFGQANFVENAVFSHVVPGSGMWTPDVPIYKTQLDSLYVVGIMSPESKGYPRDTWGNIKVPRIEYYEGTSIPGDEGWYKTVKMGNDSLESYSSFIGIPIIGIDSPEFIDYSTTIQGMYFSLTCDPYLGELRFAFNHQTWLGDIFWNNYTIGHAGIPSDDPKPFTFVFRRKGFPLLNCTAETAYVEVGVTCPTYTTCFASRVRRSRHEHPPTVYTRLGWFLGVGPPTPFSVNVSKPAGSDDYASQKNEPAMSLYSSPWLGLQKNWMEEASASASEVDYKGFSIRLSQLLNAYWITMYSKNSLWGITNVTTLPPDEKRIWSYQDERYSDKLSGEAHALSAETWPSTGTKRINRIVFQAHYGWVLALIVSSAVLITASLIPCYIRTVTTRCPDILMNLSSLATRDNPYIALPMTGTYLDGADRSRYFRYTRIRFGDVEEGSEAGRLAIGQLGVDVAALKKGRKYM
jgi:hypothetical protein